MNHTLTGLGLALVVALATALVGPLFVDWGNHRAAFEAQASRMLGVPVRVLGEVEARLLPSPRIRFSQVVAGDEWAASKFTADSFELDIALTPLLRGEYQVSSLRVDGADLKTSLSADGEISLPVAPGGMTALDAIAITDLDLTRARITVADPAANRRIVVEDADLKGEASSLAGPMKFTAHGRIGERTYVLRASTGRFDAGGLGDVKLSLGSADAPALSLDGRLLLGKKPHFDGTGSLVQVAAAEGQPAREPWKVSGAVKADSRKLDAAKVEFEYGAPGRELRLAGGLGIVFGPKPSADIRIKGRQIDLDRALGRAKDAAPLAPADALATFAERFAALAAPPLPLRVTTEIENVSLGGDMMQNLRASIASTPGGWTVENLSARLPGGADVNGSGALLVREGEGPRFTGPVKLDAPNVPSLVHWLAGNTGPRPTFALRKLKLDAALAARSGSFALEDLKATADDAEVKGRLAFTGVKDGRNKLEARLTAEKLDLDALDPQRLRAFAGTSKGTDIELALRARKLTYAKVVWSGVDIDLTANSDAVDIRRLAIADLGGAKIAATGRLSGGDSQPAGKLEARIEAASLNGLVTVLRTSSLPPALIDALGARAAVIAPASLNAVFASSGGTGGATVKVSGTLGGTALELNASAPRFALTGPLKAKLTASSEDGARLFSQFGVPAIAFESFGGANVEASLNGDPANGASVEAVVVSAADRLTFKGRTDTKDGGLFAGRLDVALDDAGRYAALLGRVPPASLPTIPLTAGGDVSYGDKGFQIARLAGLVQGRALKGDLVYGGKAGLRGEIGLASLSLSELAGIALGPLALDEADAAGWPAGTLGPGVFDGLEGRVTVRTDTFDIAPGYRGGKTKFILALGRNEFAIQDAETTLAGGMLKGNVALRRADADLSLAARLSVEGAKLGDVVWGGAGGPAATGSLDLTADMLGSGNSLSAIVSGLTGSGSFSVHEATFGGVDAGAFERTLIAVEGRTEPADAAYITRRFTSELAMDDLEVSEISSAFTIASGVARVGNAAITAPLVNASASGTLNLPGKTLNAHLVLRPKILADIADASIPQADLILAGPWNAPARTSDTTAFANVLATRAVEREIKRVEQMEAERKERERKAAEEAARRAVEEARRAAEEAEAAKAKAILDATGDVPIGDLPPPVDLMPKTQTSTPRPVPRSSARDNQSPLDFLRRPVVPEASR